MTLALLFALAQGAWAEDVDYIYYRVIDLGYEASIYKNNGKASNPTVLTSTLLENSNEDNLDTGWYVLSQNLRTDEITTSEEAAATITFVGTYKKLTFDDEDRTVLFFGENNMLCYPQSGATIGAQRAYFQLSGITAGATDNAAVNVRAFALDFGKDGTSTGIIEMEAPLTLHALPKSGWYSLDGRRLSGKPKARGIYINNGRKIVIK